MCKDVVMIETEIRKKGMKRNFRLFIDVIKLLLLLHHFGCQIM